MNTKLKSGLIALALAGASIFPTSCATTGNAYNSKIQRLGENQTYINSYGKLSNDYLVNAPNRLDSSVAGINLSVNVDKELTVNFGKQQFRSSSWNNLPLAINKETFYGFEPTQIIDFDNDGLPDASVQWSWGGGGSGFLQGNLFISSKTRKAWIYMNSTGAGYWAGVDIPDIGHIFSVLEVRDWMPTFPEISETNSISHGESLGFIFTHVWTGNGFAYKPIPDFYRKLMPLVNDAIRQVNGNDQHELYVKSIYQRIAKDFERACNGEKISKETLNSSKWKLLAESE